MTCLLVHIPIRFPWGIDTAFAGMAFMACGHYLRYNNFFSKSHKWLVLGILVLYIGLCNWNPGIAMSVREYGNHGILSSICFIIIGFLGSILYIELSKILCKLLMINKVLCYIGQKTLPILAFHVFIFMVWDTVLEKVLLVLGTNLSESNLFWIVGILKVIVTIMICIAGSWCWSQLKKRVRRKSYGEKAL